MIVYIDFDAILYLWTALYWTFLAVGGLIFACLMIVGVIEMLDGDER